MIPSLKDLQDASNGAKHPARQTLIFCNEHKGLFHLHKQRSLLEYVDKILDLSDTDP